MNRLPEHSIPVSGAGEEQGMEHTKHEWQPETLHELAREYFGNDFSAETEQACPGHASLRATAQSGRLPDDALRAHLFGCSACFTAYRTALTARAVDVPAITGQAKSSNWLAWPASVRPAFWRLPAGAWLGAAALLLISISWLGWLRGQRLPASEPPGSQTQAEARPAPPPTATASLPAVPAAAHSRRPAPSPSSSLPDHSIMPIDLNDYVALRGAGSPADRRSAVIVLAPAHTQLQLRLPEGSLAGQYRVRLLDERNLPVRQAKQPSRDGQRLTVTLDLRAVAPKNYRLEIFHPGEPPALYQVQLAGQR